MAEKKTRRPTQKTPKGYEIPVPRRRDVEKLLRRSAAPQPDPDQGRKAKG